MDFPDCNLLPGSNVTSYVRVSTAGQLIDHQTEYIENYCNFHQLNQVRMFQDVAQSGASLAGRYGLADLVKYLTNPPPDDPLSDGVIFYDTSRLARDMDDTQFVFTLLTQHNYEVVFIQDDIPAGMPGRLMLTINAYGNQKYREYIRQKVIDTHAQIRTGTIPGVYLGHLPYGFLYEKVDSGYVDKNGNKRYWTRLVGPDPKLMPAFTQAFQMRLQMLNGKNISFRDIDEVTQLCPYRIDWDTAEAKEKGRVSQWYGSMCRRPIYKGTYVNNQKYYIKSRREAPKGVKIQVEKKSNPIIEGTHIIRNYYIVSDEYESFVAPMVDPALWEAVNEAKGKRRKPRLGTAKTHLLSGLVFCLRCKGAYMSRTTIVRDKRYFYYACKVCGFGMQNIRAEALDMAVIEKIHSILSPSIIVEFTKVVNAYIEQQNSTKGDVQKDIEMARRQRQNLLTLVKEHGDKEAEQEYLRLGRQLKELEFKQSRQRSVRVIKANPDEITAILGELAASLTSEDRRIKQLALKRAISRVDARRDGALVTGSVTPNLNALCAFPIFWQGETPSKALIKPIEFVVEL